MFTILVYDEQQNVYSSTNIYEETYADVVRAGDKLNQPFTVYKQSGWHNGFPYYKPYDPIIYK